MFFVVTSSQFSSVILCMCFGTCVFELEGFNNSLCISPLILYLLLWIHLQLSKQMISSAAALNEVFNLHILSCLCCKESMFFFDLLLITCSILLCWHKDTVFDLLVFQ